MQISSQCVRCIDCLLQEVTAFKSLHLKLNFYGKASKRKSLLNLFSVGYSKDLVVFLGKIAAKNRLTSLEKPIRGFLLLLSHHRLPLEAEEMTHGLRGSSWWLLWMGPCCSWCSLIFSPSGDGKAGEELKRFSGLAVLSGPEQNDRIGEFLVWLMLHLLSAISKPACCSCTVDGTELTKKKAFWILLLVFYKLGGK